MTIDPAILLILVPITVAGIGKGAVAAFHKVGEFNQHKTVVEAWMVSHEAMDVKRHQETLKGQEDLKADVRIAEENIISILSKR